MRWQPIWGDLHGQSEETIGTNSARDYFTFGRDKAFADILGHQGNDFQITGAFWAELNRLTAEFDQPGRFVTIPGYEWSGNTGIGGDRNVFYMEENRPIHRSSHALVDDLSDIDSDALDARAVNRPGQGVRRHPRSSGQRLSDHRRVLGGAEPAHRRVRPARPVRHHSRL